MNQPPKTKVFLEGRYRKLSRDLPQTIFWCPECKGHPRRKRKCERCEGFGKLTRDSIQELVAWVVGKAFGTRKNKFHGAGREDIDVRMLGSGRPFVLELINPKVFEADLAELEAEINRRNEGRLEITNLHWTEKARIRVLKETPHAKEYGAAMRIEGDVNPDHLAEILDRRITVIQKTPERVAHRRADRDRHRWIELAAMELDSEDPGLWNIRLRTQHGTYVKEAISGEGGKTNPSLASLLEVKCTCESLDVLAIMDEGGEEEMVEPRKPDTFGAGILE